MQGTLSTHKGGCHCGAVSYEVETDLATIISCNCSHCAIKGLLLTFVTADKFTLLSGEEMLTDYRFNKKKIAHLFCKVCGVQSFGRGTNKEGVPTAAINVRCLGGVDLEKLNITPVDGKNW